MPYTYTYTKPVIITPQDIYGPHETPKIPGYKIVDFRPPKKGEKYLINNSLKSSTHLIGVDTCYDDQVFANANARYILEKTEIIPGDIGYKITVQDVYNKPVEIPEGYRFVAFRPTRHNDLFLAWWDTKIMQAFGDYSLSPRIIVEKI